MKFEFEGLLKEAFGVDKAKASDISNPGTPYTFQNTLEWAVGVQPKKEPSQVSQGTPLAKQFPQEAIQEPGLEEPLISYEDFAIPVLKGVTKGATFVIKSSGQELNKFALQSADIIGSEGANKLFKLSNIVPNVNPKIVKFSNSPTWDANAAEGFLSEESKLTVNELWKKYKTYRGSDGVIRQYDYDGFNTVDLDKLQFTKGKLFKGHLIDFYASPTIYKSHPHLQNTKLEIFFEPNISAKDSAGVGANYNIDKNRIQIKVANDFFEYKNLNNLKQEILDSLVHEPTHKAQADYNISVTKSTLFDRLMGKPKPEGKTVNEGSNVDLEPISVKEYAMLKGNRESLVNNNVLTRKEATREIIKHLKDIQSKLYYSNAGEAEAFTAEQLRRIPEEAFNFVAPSRMQTPYYTSHNIKENERIHENILPRIEKEWGSYKNYVQALKDLYDIPD